MKAIQILQEANVAAKIKDPKTVKMLAIAMRHDSTIPRNKIAALGPNPTDEQVMKLWSDLLDSSLRSTDYGDLSQDGKFDEWLTRMYINGVADYEDINGEGGDALGAWKALSIRGKLKPEHQDFNRFKTLRQIQNIVRQREYGDELRRIKDAETIEKHKREKKETTLIDDDRFYVTLPYNYGACYTFNNSAGYQASFCTGSSSGLRWFERYSKDGPIISIVDKDNMDDVNGKWQMHGPTGQMNNGNQSLSYHRGDEKFAELFPGLMKKIIAALRSNADEVKKNSTEIVPDGYDIDKAIADIKKNLPQSYAAEAEQDQEAEAEPEANDDDRAGTWRITQISSGRSVSLSGDNLQAVQQRVLDRYPDSTVDDYSWERQPD